MWYFSVKFAWYHLIYEKNSKSSDSKINSDQIMAARF